MFETDRLPVPWVQACNQMDAIWVPSEFNRRTFTDAGVAPEKLAVIPGCFDPTPFQAPFVPTALTYSGSLLQSIQDWAGRMTSFAYDTASACPLNLLTTVTGPTGCQTQYQYSTFTLSTLTFGACTNSGWLLSGIVDPNGYGTSYSYDQRFSIFLVVGLASTTSTRKPYSHS